MPRKRKIHSRRPTQNTLINVNATLKKLKSQLTDPWVYYWLFRGAKGVRERLLVKVEYEKDEETGREEPVGFTLRKEFSAYLLYCILTEIATHKADIDHPIYYSVIRFSKTGTRSIPDFVRSKNLTVQ